MPSCSYIVDSSDRNDFNHETETTATPERYGPPPSNLLGKELQSALKPINMMQAVFFCAKYKIRGNMVTANSVLYNIISVGAMLTVSCFCYFSSFGFSFSHDATGFEYIQYCARIYVYVVVVTGNFLNCCNNIMQRYNNVLFIKKVQAVFNSLNMNKSFKRYIYPHWIHVFMLISYHLANITFSFCIIDFMGFGLSFTNQIWLLLDVNILYATRIMKLLIKPLKSWVKKIKMSEHVGNLENDDYWKTMFEVYLEILEAYKIFEKTFSELILFYIAVTTSKSLISITVRIEMKKVTAGSHTSYAVLSFISLTWIIKNMLLIIFLCVENEEFFSAMAEVQRVCVQLANSSGCSESQKRVCKNVQRFQKTSFKKMRACGLFIIDAALSIRVCALITTYTIVILQFEFL